MPKATKRDLLTRTHLRIDPIRDRSCEGLEKHFEEMALENEREAREAKLISNGRAWYREAARCWIKANKPKKAVKALRLADEPDLALLLRKLGDVRRENLIKLVRLLEQFA